MTKAKTKTGKIRYKISPLTLMKLVVADYAPTPSFQTFLRPFRSGGAVGAGKRGEGGLATKGELSN